LIKNPLGVPNYDKTRFEPRINACSANPDKWLLNEEQLAHYLSVFRSTEKRATLPAVVVSLSSVGELAAQVASLQARVVTAKTPMRRLKDDPEVEGWVNAGRPLHERKESCQFCGQVLPSDLLTQLSEHFSADYDNLMAQLRTLETTIQAAGPAEITLPHPAQFYPELADRFATQRQHLMGFLAERTSALDNLVRALARKRAKVFTSLPPTSVDDPATQIALVVASVNNTISTHNTRTTEFDTLRQDAFTKLEAHHAASFVRDKRYNELLQQVAYIDATTVAQAMRFAELDAEIRNLEQTLTGAHRGAERINTLLAAYFGKDDLRISLTTDKRYQIARGDTLAKNLSEGEKTAIAFAYFITRVQDGRQPLADTTIVIDDPVSSLDGNHLYNTYALIKTRLGACHQLFISTHNFEFYSLIRDWAKEKGNLRNPQADWKEWGCSS
jgi:wobble nucleotide-excising tRNase